MGRPDLAIGVLRTVQRRAADQLDLFHGAGVDWATASPEMMQEAGQAIANIQQLNGMVQSTNVRAGRVLRVFSLPNSQRYLEAMARGESLGMPPGMATGPVGMKRAVPPLPSTREELSDWFDLWGMTKRNPKLQEAFLSGIRMVPTAGKYLASSAANFVTANILSAPKPLLLNVAGRAACSGGTTRRSRRRWRLPRHCPPLPESRRRKVP
jgi:hypothetical protein